MKDRRKRPEIIHVLSDPRSLVRAKGQTRLALRRAIAIATPPDGPPAVDIERPA